MSFLVNHKNVACLKPMYLLIHIDIFSVNGEVLKARFHLSSNASSCH